MRERLTRVLGGLVLWVLALVAVPVALAGDQFDPDTDIVTGPPGQTSSTTADFTFTSTAARAAFYCRLDGDDLTEYVPCETPWRVEGLGLGHHLLQVYSVNLNTGRVDPEPDFWEWEVVPGEPPPDAGTLDGGTSGGDAGPGDLDGGTSGNDGGSTDAGPGDTDGGSPGNEDGGTSGSDGGTSGSDGGSSGSDGGSSGSDGGSSGSDGGTPGGEDAGTSGNDDAGSADDDAGTPDGDAGTDDAGTPGGDTDAGDGPPGPPPSDDGDLPADSLDYLGGGVGCTGAPAPGAVAGLLLLALALRRRRRP